MESLESYFFVEGGRVIVNDLDNLSQLIGGLSITNAIKNKFFELIKIRGDGNCLFNAISYMLINKYDSPEETPKKLREDLYNFYKSRDYQRIKTGRNLVNDFEESFYISTTEAAGDAEYDYVDDPEGIYFRHNEFRGLYNTLPDIGDRHAEYMMGHPYTRIAHTENIKNNGVFGSNGDTIALSYTKNINIVVIIEDRFVNRETPRYYRVDPYIRNNNSDRIYLLLSGESHYDILMPRNEPFDRLVGLPTSPMSKRHTTKSKSSPKTDYSSMTVNELKKIITDKGLTAKTKGFIEKREFIELLRGTRKSKSPTSKKVDSNRGDTRKSKSPSRNKTIKIDRDEKKLQELFQTHEDLQQSINELETLLGKLTEHKDTDNASQVNNELKRQKLELKQIEKKIHKITETEFSLLYEISRLFSRLTLRK
jgi:hypothetical protein